MSIIIPTRINQTTAEWALDSTVYPAYKILCETNAFYGATDQCKFKLADGVQTWAQLNYFPVSGFDDATSSIQTQLNAATSSLGSPLNITTAQTHTGSTAEVIMPIDCPNLVGVLISGDILNLMLYLQATNNANVKTVKFYISDSQDVLLNEVLIGTGVGTTGFINTARIEKIMLMTSLTTQLVVSGTTTGIAGWGSVMTGLSIDFSSGTKYLCVTFQLASSSDTMKLQFAFSQINRKF